MKKAGEECGKCSYWQRLGEHTGECRINPPISTPSESSGRWLIINDDEWCGQFKEEPMPPMPLPDNLGGTLKMGRRE